MIACVIQSFIWTCSTEQNITARNHPKHLSVLGQSHNSASPYFNYTSKTLNVYFSHLLFFCLALCISSLVEILITSIILAYFIESIMMTNNYILAISCKCIQRRQFTVTIHIRLVCIAVIA